MNQQITFLSDGSDTVRHLQSYLNPQAEHLLDWFPLAMRLTVLQPAAYFTLRGRGDGNIISRPNHLRVDYGLMRPVWRPTMNVSRSST
jgi:hypothetical protein